MLNYYVKNLETPNMVRVGDVLDIKVTDLLEWNEWWLRKSNITLFKSNRITFQEQQLSLDPYLLGHWLGDGHSKGASFTTMDQEIVKYYEETLINHTLSTYSDKGKAKTYGIRANKGFTNTFLKSLQNHNLINNKHIPSTYKTSSVQQRLTLLVRYY